MRIRFQAVDVFLMRFIFLLNPSSNEGKFESMEDRFTFFVSRNEGF